MKLSNSKLTGLTIIFIFLLFPQLLKAQCTVQQIYPYNLSYSASGGSQNSTINTYPYSCSLSFTNVPSWVTINYQGSEIYSFTCSVNTGTARSCHIYIGSYDFIGISQAGVSYPTLTGGYISGASTTCYNTSPGLITNTTSPTGGTGTYYYQWMHSSDGTNYYDISGATSSTYTPVPLGADMSYRRKVTSGTQTALSNIVWVDVYPILTTSGISGGSSVICANSSTGDMTATRDGGTNSYTYMWYKNNGATGVTTQVYPSETLTASSTYYCIITSAPCGSVTTPTKQIIVNSLSTQPTRINVQSSSICYGNSTILTVYEGILGTGAVWKWYSGSCGGAFIGTGESITVTPASTTTYYVRAEGTCNSTNCVYATVTVRNFSVEATSITFSSDNICPGFQTTLTVNGGVLGTGASWRWYTSNCGVTSVGTGHSINVNPTSTTTYYVRAEGECNTTNCISAALSVSTISTAPSSITINANNICPGISSTLTVTGGSLVSGDSWKWYSGSCGGTSIGAGTSLSVSPSATTTYYVRAEGECGMTACASASLIVKTYSSPATSITLGSNNVCPATPVSLTVVGGSTGTGAHWIWYADNCGGVSIGNGGIITATPTVTSNYYVRAEGDCGMTECISQAITVLLLPSITVQPTNATVQPNQDASFSVTATGPNLQYQWESSITKFGTWAPLTGPPAINTNTQNMTIQGAGLPSEMKFYRCKVTSDCQLIYSNPVSLSVLKQPVLSSQSPEYIEAAEDATLSIRAHSDNGLDWKNRSIWSIGGNGNVEWDNEKQAWRVIGYVTMYLNNTYAIPIDVSRSYTISVEVFRENNQSQTLYWGGKRLASNKTTALSGYGGTYDYSATLGAKSPAIDQWVTYKINAKTGEANSYYGWKNDGCGYYAVGGLINYNQPTNSQITYIRNIEFYETGQGFNYQWKKDGTDIPGCNKSNFYDC